MRHPSLTRASCIALASAIALQAASRANAQANAQAAALPDARAILARYATVTGAAKMATVPGIHIKGAVEFPGMGLSGTFEGFRDAAGRNVQFLNFPSVGDFRQGGDTTFAWAIDPMQGPRLVEGKVFTYQREDEDPRAMRRDPSFVVNAQTLERAVADSEPCVKVKLTWKSGRETTECYSERTGLLLMVDAIEPTQMGDIPTTKFYREYKTMNGFMFATFVETRAMGQIQRQRTTDVTFEAIDPAKFAVPPEIEALRKH